MLRLFSIDLKLFQEIFFAGRKNEHSHRRKKTIQRDCLDRDLLHNEFVLRLRETRVQLKIYVTLYYLPS